MQSSRAVGGETRRPAAVLRGAYHAVPRPEADKAFLVSVTEVC